MSTAQIIDDQPAPEQKGSAKEDLVTWVMGKVNPAKTYRDSEYKPRWDEYYRLWRGIWAQADKSRNSERSRIITPALQQAVEGVTSEIESAILDKPHFFDMVDDEFDEDNKDIMMLRTQLREDMKEADFEQSMNQIFLTGSIFGTGIGKLKVEEIEIPSIKAGVDGLPEIVTETQIQVNLVPLLPTQFVIDTAAKSIAGALFVGHQYTTPRHNIVALQQSGAYLSGDLKGTSGTGDNDPILSDNQPDSTADTVNLLDYHGKVPRHLLEAVAMESSLDDDGDELVSLFPEDDADKDDTLVEAMIVIANGGTLLKAAENVTLLKERLFIAYRHEIVPDQFWGRGVAEKGYNSQKALDASMRARIDGLALTVHPMMGLDGSKMPKGFKFSVSPGKSIVTNGDPTTILRPISFGSMDPNVFTNTGELERMVSMSTGAFDSAAPVQVNNRNETASGMSMQLGAFVKRSKRTIRNIENEFIIPMVGITTRLYMQLDSDRYPAVDVKFKATSVLGTMARELEQAQFSAMLTNVPPESPAFWMLVKSIYELSTLANREVMVEMIEGQLQQTLNPEPPPPDPMVELKKVEIMGRIRAEAARIQVEFIRAQSEIARAANDARLAPSIEAKNESVALLNLAKAQAEDLGKSIGLYQAQLTALENNAAAPQGLANDVITQTESTGVGRTLDDLLNTGVEDLGQGV
jgi:hypothetical protein